MRSRYETAVAALGLPVGVTTLESFGAVGDGVTSDQTAFTNALAAVAAGTYSGIYLGAKTYLVTGTLSVPAGCLIAGQGHKSVIKTATNAPVLTIQAVNDWVLRDFKIEGNFTGANQCGVFMGDTAVASSGPIRGYIVNVACHSLLTGFSYARNPLSGGEYSAPLIVNCLARLCDRGFYCTNRGEYISFVNCEATQCTDGFYVDAGNVTWVGGNISGNTTGVRLTAGTNDAHGIVSGANINHNTSRNVYSAAITNGHTFSGCHLYQGALEFVSAVGLHFSGCFVDVTNYFFDGSTGTRFENCTFSNTYGNTVNDNYNAHNSQTQWLNARMIDGTIPTWVGTRVQVAYTFPSDANQTLTPQQSEAEVLNIQAGVITAGRTITSARNVTASQRIFVKNNTAQTITFQWATGTGVTIATTKAALIGSDGTNAIVLLQGA